MLENLGEINWNSKETKRCKGVKTPIYKRLWETSIVTLPHNKRLGDILLICQVLVHVMWFRGFALNQKFAHSSRYWNSRRKLLALASNDKCYTFE